MAGRRLETCRLDLVSRDLSGPQWRREIITSVADLERILDAIPAEMADHGFSERECLHVRLALDEAIVNAHKHGHQGDWGKPVVLRYHVSARGIAAQIEDQGPGFDPEEVPNPLDPENMERPSGRGLFLVRSFMSAVCHNERGNCICLCQRRTPQGPCS